MQQWTLERREGFLETSELGGRGGGLPMYATVMHMWHITGITIKLRAALFTWFFGGRNFLKTQFFVSSDKNKRLNLHIKGMPP